MNLVEFVWMEVWDDAIAIRYGARALVRVDLPQWAEQAAVGGDVPVICRNLPCSFLSGTSAAAVAGAAAGAAWRTF
jgi:hypothetical protein